MKLRKMIILIGILLGALLVSSVEASNVPYLEEWGIYSLNPNTGHTRLIYTSPTEITTLRLNDEGDTFTFYMKTGGNEYEHTEIYTLDVDGTNLKRLTENDQWDLYPSWSPDGSEIAYLSWRNTTLDIWVMSADGENQRLLYDSGGHDADIHWIGDRIVFTRDSQIWVMNSDGTDPHQLTDPPNAGDWGNAVLPFGDYDPRISPDGSQVVFERMVDDSSSHGNYDLYLVNIDGTGETRLTENGWTQGLASWSSDGERLVYVVSAIGSEGKYDLYQINSDGSGMTDLTSDIFPTEFLANSPLFSGDDSGIYFCGQWWDWKKLDTTVTCLLSSDEIQLGETVTVSGTLNPAVHEAVIQLTFTKPDGSVLTEEITTDEGEYNFNLETQEPGDWSVEAYWSGDLGHFEFKCETQSFTVLELSEIEDRGIPGFPLVTILLGLAFFMFRRQK
ncbi:MAG: hypothetical protein NWE89_00610 [Candidatus Bathyarchaeota archaeon]|nr:hypothetical protein [Candidatus Bathyarchaeota archaeon]